MRIIPALDILGGRCVRLSQGDYNTSKVYNNDPLEVAKLFEDSGLKYLHLVDLDGAKAHNIVNYNILDRICSNTSLKIDFGGGLKSDKDIQIAFESGASQVTAGSIAVHEPDTFKRWLLKYGSDRVMLGADYRDGKIATMGWLESSGTDLIHFIKENESQGVKYVVSTDVSKDGMLQGVAKDVYESILSETDVQLIASGGVSSIQDLITLKAIGCEGAIVGKAIYEGKITLKELSQLC